MLSQFLGLPINLGATLFRNGLPLTGEVLTVRVVSFLTGNEELATTVVPETSEPGVYNFPWLTPPNKLEVMVAFFVVRNKTFKEVIKIVQGPVFEPNLVGEVATDDGITGQVTDGSSIEGTVEQQGGVIGEVEGDAQLLATIDDDAETVGQID